MKICFISHSSGLYGAERSLIETIKGLKKMGAECYVILPRNGPLIEELKKIGILPYIVPYKWWAGKNVQLWRRIARSAINLIMTLPVALIIAILKCDVVYTNTIAVCVGGFAAKIIGKPHVWHIRELGYEHGLTFDLGYELSLKLIDILSTECIANSKFVAQKYNKYIHNSKLKVVYQSVIIENNLLEEKLPSSTNTDSDIKCVIVGSLSEGKGQLDSIKAIGDMVSKGIRAKIFIVGDGEEDYLKKLQCFVVENGLSDYVSFVGYIKNPFPFIQAADVLLMCSRSEAFGRVVIEAMKVGKPVIGARSGGIVELIQNGFNGFYYEPGDYRDLAEKIKLIWMNPEMAQNMGENARKWATAQFNEKIYQEEILKILQKARNDL
ncbi:MAG: glycosyltransferase family 4 protein [Methanothrix sp.]